MEFNEKLQKLRTNENLTQEELAEKLSMSHVLPFQNGNPAEDIQALTH